MPAGAEGVRVATFNAELTRDGPGLLLRDIVSGVDPQVEAAARVVAAADPDILLLTGIDYDLTLESVAAFAARLRAVGDDYPYRFALRPNTGRATGFDLDGDGRMGGPGDAQGWGRFAGSGGMAILSRFPIDESGVRDFSGFLWADLPGALIEGIPQDRLEIQRLSTTAHWDVPVEIGRGRLHLLAWYATPPVFDGPDDLNGRRNHDEAAFWLQLLDGQLGMPPPPPPFVLLGDANLDPRDGQGRPDALDTLLSDPRLRDPKPESDGGRAAADPGHAGDPTLDTADWPGAADTPPGPGNLRVDYVLPSSDLKVLGSGVWWPAPGGKDADDAATASRHRLVWVDIEVP